MMPERKGELEAELNAYLDQRRAQKLKAVIADLARMLERVTNTRAGGG